MALPEPFFVLATQNPLEMEGTYPLPEAQLDRFFFKLRVGFPSREALHAIMDRTTAAHRPAVEPVLDGARLLGLRAIAAEVPVARAVQDYALRLLEATHPSSPSAPEPVRRFVRYGSSPRGAQAMLLGGKVRALLAGRFSVAAEDVRALAAPALRHRMILNFEGEAEAIDPDALVGAILSAVEAGEGARSRA
jgi:MoxR-like ATPase